MQQTSFKDPWAKRVRGLTQALIISGTLNLGLITTFIYFVFKEKHFLITQLELRPTEPVSSASSSKSLQKAFSAYSHLPFEELVIRLSNSEYIEQGYSKRDVALSCLVAFHHFNLERALGGISLQKRQFGFCNEENEETISIQVFPGLGDYQFAAIEQYAKIEKWPLTTKGLFFEIQTANQLDPSLVEAFYLTPEFHIVFSLFNRSALPLRREILLKLLLEANFDTLESNVENVRKQPEFSLNQRRAFLLQYLEEKSQTAARILLHADYEFVFRNLDDGQMLAFLNILDKQEMVVLAKDLLASPRADEVLKKAAMIMGMESLPEQREVETKKEITAHPPTSEKISHLYPNRAESWNLDRAKAPGLDDRKSINIRNMDRLSIIQPRELSHGPKSNFQPDWGIIHVVQKGDSLWKIARKYKVSIDEIVKLNLLESERIRPGKKLQIPSQKK